MRKILVFILAMLVVPAAMAEDKQSLRRVDSLDVITKVSESLEGSGLTNRQLQTDTELRLRTMGIHVSSSAAPYLYVYVNGFKGSDYLYAYNVSVELRQRAMLRVDVDDQLIWGDDGITAGLLWPSWPSESVETSLDLSFGTWVTSWSTGAVGLVGTGKDPEGTMRASVRDLVDQFANDYLAARQAQEQLEELRRRLRERSKEEEVVLPGEPKPSEDKANL